jgi:hypothetical protein
LSPCTRISRKNRARAPGFSPTSAWSVLSATSRSIHRSRDARTSPIPPAPRRPRSSCRAASACASGVGSGSVVGDTMAASSGRDDTVTSPSGVVAPNASVASFVSAVWRVSSSCGRRMVARSYHARGGRSRDAAGGLQLRDWTRAP